MITGNRPETRQMTVQILSIGFSLICAKPALLLEYRNDTFARLQFGELT